MRAADALRRAFVCPKIEPGTAGGGHAMHTQSVSPQKGASRWDRYLFAALTALEFLMSFTFLGYIHIEPISITIAYLPILIAGCFLGVGASTAMGFFFGLSSLYKAM